MQDRMPGAPGQYKAILTAAEFQKMQAGEQFTITMTRDDQPIVEGTPYSKAAVLPDDLAAKICPDMLNPTPADALAALLSRNGSAAMTGDLPMGGHRVKDVAAPEEDGDAVNLGYANGHYRKSDWMPSASDVGARPNTWLPSIADIGAAPAGYGLGGNGEPKNWSEVDNLIANGKYQISNINQTINGIPVVSATLEVVFYGYNYGKQILRTVEAASGSGASYTLERSRGYGGWEPWECANPPMVSGVEYRTTERENGEAKYVKRIDFGALPNNTSKHISLGVAANRIRKISATARTGTTARTIPFETVTGYMCDIYLDGTDVGLYTNFDASDHTASVTIWYV